MKHLALLSFALVTLLTVIALPQPAWAQDDARAEAYELYKQGVESYKAEDYQQAVEHLEKAVEIHKNPVVYYNLSLAYSKLGRAEDALQASEMAASMEDQMPAETALKNRARIQAYGKSLRAESVAQDVANNDASRRLSQGRKLDTDMSSVGWAGAAGAGVGIVLVGTSLVLNGNIGRKIDNYEAALDAGEFNSANRLYDEIDRQQTVASVTLISGTALLLAGTGMIVYDLYFLEEEPRVQLAPSVGRDSAAIDLRLRF